MRGLIKCSKRKHNKMKKKNKRKKNNKRKIIMTLINKKKQKRKLRWMKKIEIYKYIKNFIKYVNQIFL